RQAGEGHQPGADQLTRRACPAAVDRVAIVPTVRCGCFDALPVAGPRRGDGERDGRGVRQGTCASRRRTARERRGARAAVDHDEVELPSLRLRAFAADGDGVATLVCAPLALHDATLTDFAPDHSLVAALQTAGLRNLFVTDWRSAGPDMRFFSIDSYLADLN